MWALVKDDLRARNAERFHRLAQERWSALEIVIEKHDAALVTLQDFAKAHLCDSPEEFTSRWSNRVERLGAPQNLKGFLELGYAVADGPQGPAPMRPDGRLRPGTDLPRDFRLIVTHQDRYGPLPSILGSNLFYGEQIPAIVRAHQEYRPRITRPWKIEASPDGPGTLQREPVTSATAPDPFRTFTNAPALIGLRMFVAVGTDRPENVIPRPPRRLAGVVFGTLSLDHIESAAFGPEPGEVELEITLANAGPADDIAEMTAYAEPIMAAKGALMPEARLNGGGIWARKGLSERRKPRSEDEGWTTNFVVPAYMQRWRVRAYATEKFTAQSQPLQAIWVGAGGLVLTGLLTGLVAAQARGWRRAREALWYAHRAQQVAQLAAQAEAAKNHHLHDQVLNPLRAFLSAVNQRIHTVAHLKRAHGDITPGLEALESQLEADREQLEAWQTELRGRLGGSWKENQAAVSEAGLRRELQRAGAAGGAVVILKADIGFFSALDAQQADCVHGVAWEAVTNAWRHGHAQVVEVLCQLRASTAQVTIVDNGSGFEPTQIGRNGLGLAGFHERARRLGGQASVSSKPGGTTIVQFEFPLRH